MSGEHIQDRQANEIVGPFGFAAGVFLVLLPVFRVVLASARLASRARGACDVGLLAPQWPPRRVGTAIVFPVLCRVRASDSGVPVRPSPDMTRR